jgi:hypothetical protein
MHPERRPDPERSLEELAARLRALPAPSAPAELEGRLLASIPAAFSLRPRHRTRWVGVIGALAAACLLALLVWYGRSVNDPAPQSVRKDLPRPTVKGSDAIDPWLEARQPLHGTDASAFSWPVEETAPLRRSIAIPADLFQ